MEFEWHSRKAAGNLRKHKVSFEEPSTVFGDVLSMTISDPDHSLHENRLITIGQSSRMRLLMVAHAQRDRRVSIMKQSRNTTSDDLRPEYDLRQLLKGATRGKYAKSYRANSNVVVLDPNVHDIFRDARAVNDALRLVIELRKVAGRTRVSKN